MRKDIPLMPEEIQVDKSFLHQSFFERMVKPAFTGVVWSAGIAGVGFGLTYISAAFLAASSFAAPVLALGVAVNMIGYGLLGVAAPAWLLSTVGVAMTTENNDDSKVAYKLKGKANDIAKVYALDRAICKLTSSFNNVSAVPDEKIKHIEKLILKNKDALARVKLEQHKEISTSIFGPDILKTQFSGINYVVRYPVTKGSGVLAKQVVARLELREA